MPHIKVEAKASSHDKRKNDDENILSFLRTGSAHPRWKITR